MIRRKIKNDEVLSEINVTPFIDIMLVLLIIFMLVAPLITSSFKIELPKSASGQKDEQKILVLFISPEKLALNGREIQINELNSALENEISNENLKEKPVIYLHIDKSVNYEKIVSIMQELKAAKYDKIALSTELSE